MKKSTVAVGEKVFMVAENGQTIDITDETKNFVKAMKKDWPDQPHNADVENVEISTGLLQQIAGIVNYSCDRYVILDGRVDGQHGRELMNRIQEVGLDE